MLCGVGMSITPGKVNNTIASWQHIQKVRRLSSGVASLEQEARSGSDLPLEDSMWLISHPMYESPNIELVSAGPLVLGEKKELDQ